MFFSAHLNDNHQSETFLRAIQGTDSNRQVAFTTRYPGSRLDVGTAA